ncbi:hypothetical protein FQZ97_1145730 [compost metagenome]
MHPVAAHQIEEQLRLVGLIMRSDPRAITGPQLQRPAQLLQGTLLALGQQQLLHFSEVMQELLQRLHRPMGRRQAPHIIGKLQPQLAGDIRKAGQRPGLPVR